MSSEKNKLSVFYKEMGKLIASFRKEKKYSLEELGMQIGLDRSAMHRIENGKPITVTTLLKLALALDKTPQELLDINLTLKPNELGDLITVRKAPKHKKKAARKKK